MKRVRGKSILVIDDDDAMLRALGKVLRNEGAEVTSASWGGEAADYLAQEQGKFDLVITDLRMPVISGGSLLLTVKGTFPDLPIIVISAYGSPEVKSQCIEMGASAFLEKPLDTRQLLNAVEETLSKASPRTP